MEVDKLLKSKVSYQKSAWAPISKELTIKEILSQIQNGELSLQIQRLREIKDNNELYTLHKRNFPSGRGLARQWVHYIMNEESRPRDMKRRCK